LAAATLLAGCGPKLPYEPAPFLTSVRNLSADYTVLQDRVLVEVFTEGYRFEQVWIITGEGEQVRPLHIEYNSGGGGGMGVGVASGGSGGAVGVGVGVGSGSSRVHGNTKLLFDRAAIGDAPWTLHVKLLSLPKTQIVLPAKAGD
jgi:hypothetical protein